jgi:hypothetical protein
MAFLKRFTAPFLVAAVLAACGGGSGGGTSSAQTDKDRIAVLEAQGKLPKLDRSSDLKGPDANGDGVRDDIEAILKGWYAGEQLSAAMQFARGYQTIFDLPVGDRDAALSATNQGMRAMKCVYRKFEGGNLEKNPSIVSDKIVAMTFNTKARMRTYMNYNHALDGTVWSIPSGNTCDE